MTTQEIYIVEPSTSEEAKALKAFAKALDEATLPEPRLQGVLSTKGSL